MKNLTASDFQLSGDSLDKLKKDLEYIDSVTHILEANLSNIVLTCPCPEKDTEEYIGVYISYPIEGPRFGHIKRVSMIEDCFNDSVGMMLCHEKRLYMDANVITSLSVLVDLGGRAIQVNVPERNNFLAKLFDLNDRLVKIVYRQNPDEPKEVKAFHAFTTRYTPIPQKSIMKIVSAVSDGMGATKVRYSINHYRTMVFLEFPEVAEEFSKEYGLKKSIVPGVLILNSDVGTTALTVKGTLRSGDSVRSMCFGKCLAKHEGDYDKSYKRIIEEVKEKIFPQFRSYMNRFMDLLLIDINNPSDCVEWILKKSGMVKAIGKKNTNTVRAFVISEIDTNAKYTAYDIVMLFLDLVDRVENLNYESDKGFSEALNKIVFLDFEHYDESDIPDIVIKR